MMERNSDKDKITIYDVANYAGVAISTVSRVLNDSHEVSEQTRKRVLEAVEKLQFRPDRTAKTLALKQSSALAVAVPSFTSLFYNEILKGVKDYLRDRDMDLLLCNLGSGSPSKTLSRFLSRGAVDGLLILSLPIDERLERELKMLHAPVVLVGTKSTEFDCFYWDEAAGSRTAIRHLIELGHRRIGMIAAHPWSFSTEARIHGYRLMLEEADLPFDPALVQTGTTVKHAGFSEEAGYEAMTRLLEFEPRVTAVYAHSDVQAIGAWRKLREVGLAVPDDVALVGHDGIKISRYIDLTTVDMNMHAIGNKATELIMNRMKTRREKPQATVVTPRLIVRGSSQKPRENGTG